MGRSPCRSEEEGPISRGAWTAQEDKLLTSFIETHGQGKWTLIPKRTGLNRSGKSCRLRWLNYLRPDIKRGNITQDEEDLIIRLHKLLGNRWSLIAGRLPGRTDNEIKNYWNTTLAKKLRTQLCSISEQDRTSESAASKPDVTQRRVIHTKASRFRNVAIQDPQCPKGKSLASNELQIDEARLTAHEFSNLCQGSYTSKAQLQDEYQFHQNHNSDVNLWSPGRNEFLDQLNAEDFCSYFNLDSNIMDLQVDQPTPVDELMVNRLTTSGIFQDNVTLDLDMALMDSEGWP